MRARAILFCCLALSSTVLAGEGPPVDPGKARKANAAGMKLYRAQRWPEALHQFEEAVGWDPALVAAHYNLACLSALSGDDGTALDELAWLKASGDPKASTALDKARRDPDLETVRARFFGDGAWSAFEGFVALGTTTRGRETLKVDMKGARLLDDRNQVVARGEPLDATGGSQDGVAAFAVGQVVPDEDPEIVIHYTSGGRAEWWDGILVLKRRGKELVAILEATLGRNEWKETAKLSLSKEGAIRYRAPGKPVQTLRWDAAGFAYR